MVRPRIPTIGIACALLAVAFPGLGHSASGFVLRRSAIASAGGIVTSSHGMVLGLTAAQSVTGVDANGAPLHESTGYWTGARWNYVVGVEEPGPAQVPARFDLAPISPNPSPGSAVLRFAVPAASAQGARVNLAVYDVSGRLVRTLLAGPQDPGEHSITWNGTSSSGARVGSGIYFVSMSAPAAHVVRRLVLLR